MSDYLPTEVLSDILTRLPVKSLLRCTSVCKSWYSLITSPNFITTHLNRTISNKFLVRHRTDVNEKLFTEHYSVHCDNDTFDEFAKLDFPFPSRGNYYFNIVGMCNGLVCLFDDEGNKTDIINLWNPSLKKSLTLPKPSIVFESHGSLHCCVGFGIDPVTNDYKVVRVVYLVSDTIIVPPEVEIYELSTGLWRNVTAGGFSYIIMGHAPQAFLNGIVHWIGLDPKEVGGGSFTNVIATFDMRTERLGTVMVPRSAQKKWNWNTRVVVIGELLSLINPVGYSWCIWVMKEYGVESSWTKQFTVNGQGGLGRPLCFRGNGDILLPRSRGDCDQGELVSYNPKSKRIKNLEIRVTPDSFYIDTYKESLALIKGITEVLGKKGENEVEVNERSEMKMKEES